MTVTLYCTAMTSVSDCMLVAEMVTAGEQLLFGDHQFYNVLITSMSAAVAGALVMVSVSP